MGSSIRTNSGLHNPTTCETSETSENYSTATTCEDADSTAHQCGIFQGGEQEKP
jgi:hypothetical protein